MRIEQSWKTAGSSWPLRTDVAKNISSGIEVVVTSLTRITFFTLEDSQNFIWSGIEVVITGLTRNQLRGDPPWVRIPPAPPRRRGLRIVRDDFFSKSHRSFTPSLLLSRSDPLRWAPIWGHELAPASFLLQDTGAPASGSFAGVFLGLLTRGLISPITHLVKDRDRRHGIVEAGIL